MGIWKSFTRGFIDTAKNYKVISYLWIINLLFSLLAVAPIYAFITKGLSESLMGDRLQMQLDFLWLGDVIYQLFESGSVLLLWVLVPAAGFWLLYVFLNGGILGTLKDSMEKVTLQHFFGHCGYYFWRFGKLFAISLLFYLVFVGAVYGIICELSDLLLKNATTQWPLIIAGFVKMAIFILLFSFVNMLFDYAKIRLVMTDNPKVFRELLETIRFVSRNLWRAWGLYFLIGILFVLVSVLYMEVAQVIPDHSLPLMLLLFLWQQVFIISRVWIKLHFFAAQMTFYHSRQ